MSDRIVGYHFQMQFGPLWRGVLPFVTERARALGLAPSELALELGPRAQMLVVGGTYWKGMRTGEVNFQVFEHRSDLDAGVLQEPCVTSRQWLAPFGVQKESKGWTSSKLSKAVGLWIRNGSLVFQAWQDQRGSAPEVVLVDFDMWQALDAMARLAAGEPSFGPPVGEPAAAGTSTPYASPPWARELATKAGLLEPARVQAAFSTEKFLVAGVVTLMERAEGG